MPVATNNAKAIRDLTYVRDTLSGMKLHLSRSGPMDPLVEAVMGRVDDGLVDEVIESLKNEEEGVPPD